ncbi:hypothetical protein PR202_ga10438 [Eleusine coracana subsp. coracana]|uniref:Uncharacterized protein n=1 Tax=Eleusine coracana subsp. coracana TaxID=191504 RepID=A0AAV5C6P7_ELECO|nr:hypothetical protein PR202_ga10438 [Eleusine coracana subsp. coracana]
MLRKMGSLLSSLSNVSSTQHQLRHSLRLRLMMGLLLRHSLLCFSQPCPNLACHDPELKCTTVFQHSQCPESAALALRVRFSSAHLIRTSGNEMNLLFPLHNRISGFSKERPLEFCGGYLCSLDEELGICTCHLEKRRDCSVFQLV